MKDAIIDRAALILNLLGDQMSDEVLAHLDPSHAERLRAQRKTLKRANRRQQESVFDDFERYLRFIEQQSGPQIKLHEGERETAKNSRRRESAAPLKITLDPDADPIEAFEQVTESQLAGALQTEPPSAIALLLGILPPRRSADVLANLAGPQRDRVIAELGREQAVSPAVIERLLQTILMRARTIPIEEVKQVYRIQRLADVLRAVPRRQRREMLQTFEEHDPETAAAVQGKLYVFDDLEATEDRTVQKLLTEIDGSSLAMALSNASDTTREKIFNNLSRRARMTLQEELEFQTNISDKEVEKARIEVVAILARLDMEAE